MGLVWDCIGWKVALVFTTLLIVLRVGATVGTVTYGAYCSAEDLFWFLTFAWGDNVAAERGSRRPDGRGS